VAMHDKFTTKACIFYRSKSTYSCFGNFLQCTYTLNFGYEKVSCSIHNISRLDHTTLCSINNWQIKIKKKILVDVNAYFNLRTSGSHALRHVLHVVHRLPSMSAGCILCTNLPTQKPSCRNLQEIWCQDVFHKSDQLRRIVRTFRGILIL